MSTVSDNADERYCDAIDRMIKADHPYFMYRSAIVEAEAFLALSVASGYRVNEIREIIEMLDTIFENMTDRNAVLPDNLRKMLNHSEDVWLDLKDKFSSGDTRAAYLAAASSEMSRALHYLILLKDDESFKELVSSYQINYLKLLSIHTYREAMSHVLL